MNRIVCGQFLFLRASARTFLASAALILCCATPALAQPTFSIDGQSPSSFGSGGGFVSEGALLGVGPVPIAFGGGLGIVPTGTGPFPALTFAELDAMSFGFDSLGVGTPVGLLDFDFGDGHSMVHQWNFSVDEFAGGVPGLPVPGLDVFAEGALVALEASADVFLTTTPAPFSLSPFPPPPFSFFPGTNIQVFDGDGTTAPPLGLLEPNPPTPFVPPFGIPPSTPDLGDNLDALDVDTPTPAPGPLPFGTPVYFSMDSGFPDPIENPPGLFPGPNYATAPFNGVSGADILVAPTGGGAFAPFAFAAALGLDFFGFDTDDIDAIIVADTGPTPGVYDPVAGPYSWLGGGTDMVLFSLRRGSATIGTPDAFIGLPIEEGDILMPFGGGPPGIFVAAEDLGLGTLRSGTASFVDAFGIMWADDLDALDVLQHKRGDLTGDFVADSIDIDTLEATPAGPIPLGAPVEADLNFDFFVDPTFNSAATGMLISDVDWLVRDVHGTEYGDTNLDGSINALDAGAMFANWGTGTTWAEGDVSGDDSINAIDAGIMFAHWTSDPGPLFTAVSAPEPTTLGLAVLGLLGTSCRRRKRV